MRNILKCFCLCLLHLLISRRNDPTRAMRYHKNFLHGNPLDYEIAIDDQLCAHIHAHTMLLNGDSRTTG